MEQIDVTTAKDIARVRAEQFFQSKSLVLFGLSAGASGYSFGYRKEPYVVGEFSAMFHVDDKGECTIADHWTQN